MAITCVNCKQPLGVETGELPFKTHDGETWCPQCFCWKRTAMEPYRYFPPAYAPLACGNCKLTSVDCGRGVCGQCNSRNVRMLGPKSEPEAAAIELPPRSKRA